MLAHCHDILGHLNRAEPLLMLLVTHAVSTMTSQNVRCDNNQTITGSILYAVSWQVAIFIKLAFYVYIKEKVQLSLRTEVTLKSTF